MRLDVDLNQPLRAGKNFRPAYVISSSLPLLPSLPIFSTTSKKHASAWAPVARISLKHPRSNSMNIRTRNLVTAYPVAIENIPKVKAYHYENSRRQSQREIHTLTNGDSRICSKASFHATRGYEIVTGIKNANFQP